MAESVSMTAGSGLGNVARFLPALAAALATAGFASFVPAVARGDIPSIAMPWVPAFGIDFAFRLDGLALAFALLICGIGALVFLYAATYFATDRRLGSLLVTLVAFAISMLGLVTADDAITLFVFWELTTVTSWLLVGFDHERASARAAALQALVVTGGGGLALFAGLLLMAGISGTFRLSEMNALGDVFRQSPLYAPVFWLVVAGCFTKSAQFPFQFWLPNAMAAPTPVSAYLHSATMVKAGVFLLARFTPALGGTELWTLVLVPVGAFTMVLSSVWAMRQTDLKLMLAYTTVMGLSLITMLLGIGTPAAAVAAMTFLLVHAFYKAGLFLAVGMIEKGAGSRDYPAVGGLAGAMPLTAAATALAALSMAGLPPLFGFVAKELIYEATDRVQVLALVVTGAAVAANALMFACAGIVTLRPFLGRRRSPKDRPADPGWGLALGPVVLAALGLFCGLLPGAAEWALVGPMVASVTGAPLEGHLALWHGTGLPFLLSLLTFAIGAVLYLMLVPIRDGLAAAEPRVPRTEGWYDAAPRRPRRRGGVADLDGAERPDDQLPAADLPRARAAHPRCARRRAGELATARLNVRPIDWTIVLLVTASIVVVVRTNSRLTAITALGGVGAGIAIVYVVYGAIDVAMTQLFVEILVVVFLAIAMVRLPPSGAIPFHAGNAAVAVLLGVAVTLTLLTVLGAPLDPYLTRYFEANSYTAAHGHNIVNVILVDFRGFDTMGEISVIVIAGVAAIAALRAGRKAGR